MDGVDILTYPGLIALFGAVAPFVISLLKRPGWPEWAKQTTVIAVGLVFGGLVLALNIETGAVDTDLTVQAVVGHAAAVAVVAQLVYRLFLHAPTTDPAGLSGLQALNAKLTLSGSHTNGGLSPPSGGI